MSTSMGIIFLLMSAIMNAIQHVLEEKIYRNDAKLLPYELQAGCSTVKVILVLATVPIFKVIPVPKYICSGGILNDNFEAFTQLKSNSTLIWIYIFAIATILPAMYLSFQIIKS